MPHDVEGIPVFNQLSRYFQNLGRNSLLESTQLLALFKKFKSILLYYLNSLCLYLHIYSSIIEEEIPVVSGEFLFNSLEVSDSVP